MKVRAKKIIEVVLTIAVLLIPSYGLTQEQIQPEQPPIAKQGLPATTLDLADIVPLAANLTGRLADLKKRIRDGLNIAAVEKQYSGIEARLQDFDGQMDRLRESQDLKYRKLVELRGKIKKENELYETISLPITETIRQLEKWRKAWLTEQNQWQEWQSVLHEEGDFERLEATFEKADDTIETALVLVLSRLEAVLAAQERAG